MESLTRPAHRRKLSNANGVFSFSSKSTYDDVFAAPPPATAAAAATAAKKFKAKVGVEEYGEIFGGGSRSSSIPVLDLSALDDERRTGSEDHRSCSKKLDYAKIFGGFRDEDIAVPYEELLAAKGKKCSSDKAAMNQSVNESLLREPDSCSLSGNINGHSSEVSDQSLDGVKQVNMSYHKSSPRSKDGASGTTHIAKLHAVPGFTYFIDETARQQKTEGDRPVPVPSRRSDVQRTWSFSGNIHEENNGRKTEKPMANTLTSEGVIKGKRGSWRDGSRSNDKLFNSGEIDLKSQSFKSSPSSSPPAKRDDSKGHPKQSKSSNFASKANAFEKPGDYLTSSSDEELDMNSAAAASAAALKKAIEQAQESIRLAKELMERKKDGFQGYSKPSSKGKSRKGSRVEREANNIKENNAKETCERLNDVLQEFTGRNKKATLRTDEIATASEHSEKHSASRKVEMEKHQKNVVKIHGETTWISDLGNNGNHRTTASASRQIENKNTMKDKQVCDFGEMKTSEETSESIETSIEKTKANEQDVGLGNAENRTDVQQKAPESKETVNKSDSARMLHEYGVRNDLKITQEDILTEDIRKRFDEWEEFGKIFQEHLDVIKEEKLEHPRLEDDFMRKESQKLLEEKEPHETLQREHIEKEPEDAHVKEEENENTIGNNCNEVGGMVQEEACLFVEKDHKPIGVLGSRSYEKAHEDIQEGEDSERLGLIQGRDIDQMVVIHAHNGLETRRISEEKLKEEKVKELDLKEMELMDAHDGEKRKNILMEEHGGEEVQRRQDETYTNVEANQKIPEEDSEWEVVGKRTKEAYVNEATESLWIEADKSSENQKAEVMQETEEAESVHLKGDNFDNNQEIDFLQKADYAGNSETALGTFSKDAVLEFQEASRFEVSNESVKRSQGTVENHEDSRSTRVMNESFDQCERDADEAGAKEASELEEREISEAGPFVQSARQEHVIPSDMQSDSKAVDSDGNAANVHCNEINHAQKLSNENVFETADLVQNGVKENEINIKMEAFEAHHCDEKAAYTGSFENSRQTETEENVEEKLSFDPKIGGGLVQESGENSENIEEADVAFDKEEKRDDVKMVNKQRTMEEDSKEVRSIALASHSTTNQVSMETHKELKTVQNMQHSEEYLGKAGAVEGKEIRETKQKGLKEKDDSRKTEANKRERGWNTDRIAVERAIREARERAFAEARERAERAAVERAAAEVRQRAMTEAREKLEKATGGSKLADKASIEAKVRAERAAVERATAEARERALEKALSQKSTAEARAQEEKLSASRDNGLKHSFSSSDLESLDGTNNESAQRRKARLERHQRIMERAEKALAEKNMRDLQAQKEQAERNRLAESLDADIKRWASGKEGNLRALISTLQYILGPNSGWQPISLTEIITTAAVKKAYRKATLYVHPDKLQQRGASIQQKYICEKVFDLLKAAWNRFNSEER